MALLAGCGDSSPRACCDTNHPSPVSSADAKSVLGAAVDRTLTTKNAAVKITYNGSSDPSSGLSGDGIVDFAASKVQLHLTLAGFATIEERVIGGVVYLKAPQIENEPTQKPWSKADPSDFSSSTTTEFGTTSFSGVDPAGQDPLALLTTLRGIRGAVTDLGPVRINGVDTTRYHAVVDFADAVHASGAQAALAQQLGAAFGSPTVPEDVYLDRSGLVRRLAVSDAATKLPSSVPGGVLASSAPLSVVVDFSGFGTTDVSGITVPPANEIGSTPAG